MKEEWTDYLEVAYQAFIIVGGIAAFFLALKRIKIAEKNLRQEHFKIAGELLASKDHGYASRVAGVVMMAKIARKDPSNYERPVMRAFEAFLTYPPKYSDIYLNEGGTKQERMIDYESRDTVTIIEAIRERTRKQRSLYNFVLPIEAPFILLDKKHIIGNSANPSYGKWVILHNGRRPSYEKLVEVGL